MLRLPSALMGACLTVLLATGTLVVATPAQARDNDRRIVHHTVRPGDTATGLSVRYHAWTREFIALNGRHLRVGQRVRIPVVVSAARKAGKKHHSAHRHQHRSRHATKRHPSGPPHGWRHHRMSRTQVRGVISRQARIHGVPVNLALAVGWQESGWRQPLISSAGAIGAMQVLPSTGRWVSQLVHKRLWLRDTHGNVHAGTHLLRVLRAHTRTDRAAVAAYYEGLGGIRNGWYDETKRYVRSVMAIKRRLDRTGHP